MLHRDKGPFSTYTQLLLCCMEIKAKLTMIKIEFTIKAIAHVTCAARSATQEQRPMYSYLVNHS